MRIIAAKLHTHKHEVELHLSARDGIIREVYFAVEKPDLLLVTVKPSRVTLGVKLRYAWHMVPYIADKVISPFTVEVEMQPDGTATYLVSLTGNSISAEDIDKYTFFPVFVTRSSRSKNWTGGPAALVKVSNEYRLAIASRIPVDNRTCYAEVLPTSRETLRVRFGHGRHPVGGIGDTRVVFLREVDLVLDLVLRNLVGRDLVYLCTYRTGERIIVPADSLKQRSTS